MSRFFSIFAAIKTAPFSTVLVLLSGMGPGGVLWAVNAVHTIKNTEGLADPYTPFSRWAPFIVWNMGELAVWMMLVGGMLMVIWCVYVRMYSTLLGRPSVSAARAHALACLPLLCSALYLVTDTISPRRALAFALILTVAAHAGVWFRTLWRHDPLARFSARTRSFIIFATTCVIYLLLNTGVMIHGGVGAGAEGDEPHYLLMAHSLWHDGDLDLANNFEQQDYRAFHPRIFHNHGVTTRDGRMYSRHGVGVSILILPSYILAGYYGVVFLMSILTALLAYQMYRLIEDATDDRRLAEKAWMLLAFSPPLLIYSSQIYPEIPAGLIMLVALRRTLRTGALGWRSACALGVLAGLLPWLNARHLVLLAVLAVCFGYRIWQTRRWNLCITYLIPLICVVSGFLLYNHLLYANASLLGAYVGSQGGGSIMDLLIKKLHVPGFLGLWFEKRFGLIPLSPVYLIAMLGFPIALRAYPRYTIWIGVMTGLTWIMLSVYRDWIGGFAPTSRMLVCIVPLLGLPLAAYMHYIRTRGGRVLTAGMAGMSYTVALLLTLFPHTRYTRDWFDPNAWMALIKTHTGIDVGYLFPTYSPYDDSVQMILKTAPVLIVVGVLFYMHTERRQQRQDALSPGNISIDSAAPGHIPSTSHLKPEIPTPEAFLMARTIAIIGALDTKGAEFKFVKDEIERRGHRTFVIDTGVVGASAFKADIPPAQVAEAAGTTIQALRARNDRGEAITAMAQGVAEIIRIVHANGAIDGVIGMGGSAGTAVGASAMRALPVGFPKVMVSTVAAGDTAPYVGVKDVVMMPSVVDVAGVNRISRRIYANAAGAIVGMVETEVPAAQEKPLIAATMFGNTTKAVDQARAIMEAQGYEVLVFHCTGAGGRTMEGLVADGLIEGVLDLTTTEWADELVGGVLTAGPTRMDAAAETGTPQVIVPGCLDMVNFWGVDTVPEKFKDRKLHKWNPNVTLMRTNVEENAQLGKILAEKANRAKGPASFFLPLKGVSILDSPDNEYWWPEADGALFDAIKANARPDIPVEEMDCNINDPEFAEAVTARLLEYLGTGK